MAMSTGVSAQQPIFTNQQVFTVDDGLPQSFISGINQDKDGFLWIATLDGLARYDGRQFKIFRSLAGDASGIRANTINVSLPRANNTISLFYEGTMADDFNMETFEVKPNNLRTRLQNIPKANWKMGNGYKTTGNWYFLMEQYKGIGWLNNANGKVSYANRANGLLRQDTITAVAEAADGKVYVLSHDGVHISDTAKTKFEFIKFNTGLKILPRPTDASFFYVENTMEILPGNRLAILNNNSLIVVDVAHKTSTTYRIPEKPKTVVGDIPWFLKTDSNGQVYFSYGNRIFLLSNNGELKLLWENTAHPQLHISAFFIDRTDVLWLSVNAHGLLKIDLQSLPFQSFKYNTSFIADIMEMAGASRAAFPEHWVKQYSSYYFRQAGNNEGDLYASYNFLSQSEVYRFNKQGFQKLVHAPAGSSIYGALMLMPGNELWAFDELNYCWYRWKTFDAVPEKLQLDAKAMAGMIFADAKFIGGYIWMSSYAHGLLQFDGTKLINRFSGPEPIRNMPKDLTEICPDPVDKNKFWIGSRGGGLVLWDVNKGLQKVYSTKDGLPNNTVYCILPDAEGKIWCSTNKGIFRLDQATGLISGFEKADGLAGNEFNRAHKFSFADGRLAFGGLDGFSVFDPADFDRKENNQSVTVQLTSLQINNQLQERGNPKSIVKESLSSLAVMRLPHNKNYLRIEFAAMAYNKPNKIKYRYQLVGADKEWIDNGNNNLVAYNALRPGSYTLKINATDNNGVWSAAVKELQIVIDPPFWFSWWAYLIYTLTALTLARWFIKSRETKIKNKESLAFEKREALRLRETDEMKDRFFNNITHEFRTPLTLIMSPLDKLGSDETLSPAATASVKLAQKNSRQLLKLITELLDFSKLNSGQLKLKLAAGDFNLFVSNLIQPFEASAKEKNVSFDFSSSVEEPFRLFDEEKWQKIISNLLSNALKFTPANGAIALTVAEAGNENVQLTVSDNGPGIPASQQQKIFERFYQVDDSAIRNYGGTGIGLSLVKELTELMNGSISLESKPGSFTRFMVEIPLPKASAPQQIDNPAATFIKPTQPSLVDGEEVPLVMIVEDNDELRAFIVESMQQHYRMIEAADGLNAREIILQELPDVVISDVMMPGQDGFDLCTQCKNDNRTAHIGFILLTSKASQDAVVQGLKTGADDYITKPFNQTELELRLVNLLQLQKKVREHLQSTIITAQPQPVQPAITDPFLVQLYKEIDDKIDDAQLGVDYLCNVMAMSRSTLNRKLKALLDISANDLVRQYRLKKATALLLEGKDIANAAYSVGFSSPSYFTQCFKDQYGVTPSEYLNRQ